MVSLGSDESIMTFFSSTTDSKGRFDISILVPLSFPLGLNKVEISTGISNKYETTIFQYYVDIYSKPIITIDTNSTIQKGKTFVLSISLTEDNGKMPISKSFLKVYIDGVSDEQLTTDQLGHAVYETTYPSDTNKLEILVKYDGSKNEYYSPSESTITLSPKESESEDIDYMGELNNYWFLIIGIIAILIVAAYWVHWRRKHIPEIREVLSELMDKLETTDRSRRVIFDTYIKLLEILNRYGFIRKDSETPREFEYAIQDALPNISSKNLDSLTSLFEEARYSIHRLGKKERVKAVKNLKIIRNNLNVQPQPA